MHIIMKEKTLIMKLAGNNDNGRFGYFVNQTVLFGDAPAPVPRKIVPEALGFANAFIRVVLNIIYKLLNALIGFFVAFFPFFKLGSGKSGEFYFPHFFAPLPIFTVTSSPFSACRRDFSSILRLASLESRYSVSSISSSMVMDMFRPLNNFFTALKNSSFSSLAFKWNVVCIVQLFIQKYEYRLNYVTEPRYRLPVAVKIVNCNITMNTYYKEKYKIAPARLTQHKFIGT